MAFMKKFASGEMLGKPGKIGGLIGTPWGNWKLTKRATQATNKQIKRYV